MFGSAGRAFDAGRGFLGGFLRGHPRRKGIRVYVYHGVVDTRTDPVLERNQHTLETFRAEMRYLERFGVLSLEEVLSTVGRPGAAVESAAAVTFDDGFANNLAVAEIMSRLRLPWTVFVPSGEIGEKRAMRLVEHSLLMLRGRLSRLEALGRTWPLTGDAERRHAFRELRPRLKGLAAVERREAMRSVREQFPAGESERLVAEFPNLRILSWKELGELASAGVEIGSHGVHHDMHHAGQPREARLSELKDSRRDLEARLGRPCRAFAFPNGDTVPESASEAAEAGYLAAFTTQAREIAPEDSRFLLPRLTAPGSLRRFAREHWFAESAAGHATPAAAPRFGA
jgi:peptidoglycan/xylan/chitin deacetylase (PgdA/CDA1 family)